MPPKNTKKKPGPLDLSEVVSTALETTEWDLDAAADRTVTAAWADDNALYDLAFRGAREMARDRVRHSRNISSTSEWTPPPAGPGGEAGRFAGMLEGWRAYRLRADLLLAHATVEQMLEVAASLREHAAGTMRRAEFVEAVAKAVKKAKVRTPGELPAGVMGKLVQEHKP